MNWHRGALRRVSDRLAGVSRATANLIQSRSKAKRQRGLVLAMQGAQGDLASALAEAANASLRRAERSKGPGRRKTVRRHDDPVDTLRAVLDAAASASFDSVLVVWDEFGRHLEALLSEGRAAELRHLQSIAELAARSTDVPLTVALLTHRGLSQYASSAPQVVRTEWAKVEGRFEPIQYVDDSKEMYRLVAESVKDRRPTAPSKVQKDWLRDALKSARSCGIFRELSANAATELVEAAYPMHPLALFALPRVAARVAQNERTIFSFLANESFRRRVGLSQVYDYFADSMRADTGAGGAHRQYLETETAIRRAASEIEVEALKAACLLGLGLAGERGHVSRELLCAAISAPDGQADASTTVKTLIEKKLLLHRPHSDDVSVWHGADVDLRGALEDEKDRRRAGFNVIDFLRKELPAPVWRPVQFNDDFHIKRFFAGQYLTPAQFQSLCSNPAAARQSVDDADGSILFVLAESAGDQERVRQLASTSTPGDGIVTAVPARETALAEAALEVACLEQMLRDADLIGKDPLVEIELKHLLDDARGYLHRALDQLVTPQPSGPTFWHQGESIHPAAAADLRAWLSKVMHRIYPLTPKINNEMINRRRVSAPVGNARKKLEMAILERAGIEGLGIDGNFPDASIFRTVLVNTGLYREGANRSWGFASPDELNDPALANVWERLRAFFQDSADGEPKSFTYLFEALQAPPIGLRRGVLPVLVAAAFRAFPAAVSLRKYEAYVDDILPSVIEDICRNPDGYTLEVLELGSKQNSVIRAVQTVFSDCDPGITRQRDLMRTSFDSLRAWLNTLPPVALQTTQLTTNAVEFRSALTSQRDPVQFLFTDLGQVFKDLDEADLEAELRKVRTELEGVIDRTQAQAAEVVRRTLDVGLDRRETSLLDACQKWTKCFSVSALEGAGGVQAVAFIHRLEQRYDSDQLLLDSISSQLIGQPTNRWDDGSLARFDRALSESVRAVEEESVRLAVSGPPTRSSSITSLD